MAQQPEEHHGDDGADEVGCRALRPDVHEERRQKRDRHEIEGGVQVLQSLEIAMEKAVEDHHGGNTQGRACQNVFHVVNAQIDA